jgi:hypothetical protein
MDLQKLNFKNISIDIILVSIVAILQFFVFAILLIFSTGFLTCGNEYLGLWKGNRNGFVIGLMIFLFQFLLCKTIANKRTIIFQICIWIICFCGLVPFIALGIETFNYSKYYEPFDSEKWKSIEPKPLAMIRNIYEDHTFIGSTRKEVIEQLGEGYESWTIHENEIGYRTEGFASPLVFTFENDTVVKYELQCYD